MTKTPNPAAYEIVLADEVRMAEVEAWLDEEETAYSVAFTNWEANGYEGDSPVRGFRCNWDSVKKAWRNDAATVYILVVKNQAVGFLDGTDILEIRPDLRRNGYGRILADVMLKSAYAEGRSLVEISIAPVSAEPFWIRMGFTPVPDRRGSGGGIYAYKILPRVFRLTEGERVPFFVAFYANEEGYKDDPKSFAQFSGLGERLPDGSIQLPERAYCFQQSDDQHVDYFVRIDLAADILHFDKAKRKESRLYGVEQDNGYTYFVDRIHPNPSLPTS